MPRPTRKELEERAENSLANSAAQRLGRIAPSTRIIHETESIAEEIWYDLVGLVWNRPTGYALGAWGGAEVGAALPFAGTVPAAAGWIGRMGGRTWFLAPSTWIVFAVKLGVAIGARRLATYIADNWVQGTVHAAPAEGIPEQMPWFSWQNDRGEWVPGLLIQIGSDRGPLFWLGVLLSLGLTLSEIRHGLRTWAARMPEVAKPGAGFLRNYLLRIWRQEILGIPPVREARPLQQWAMLRAQGSRVTQLEPGFFIYLRQQLRYLFFGLRPWEEDTPAAIEAARFRLPITARIVRTPGQLVGLIRGAILRVYKPLIRVPSVLSDLRDFVFGVTDPTPWGIPPYRPRPPFRQPLPMAPPPPPLRQPLPMARIPGERLPFATVQRNQNPFPRTTNPVPRALAAEFSALARRVENHEVLIESELVRARELALRLGFQSQLVRLVQLEQQNESALLRDVRLQGAGQDYRGRFLPGSNASPRLVTPPGPLLLPRPGELIPQSPGGPLVPLPPRPTLIPPPPPGTALVPSPQSPPGVPRLTMPGGYRMGSGLPTVAQIRAAGIRLEGIFTQAEYEAAAQEFLERFVVGPQTPPLTPLDVNIRLREAMRDVTLADAFLRDTLNLHSASILVERRARILAHLGIEPQRFFSEVTSEFNRLVREDRLLRLAGRGPTVAESARFLGQAQRTVILRLAAQSGRGVLSVIGRGLLQLITVATPQDMLFLLQVENIQASMDLARLTTETANPSTAAVEIRNRQRILHGDFRPGVPSNIESGMTRAYDIAVVRGLPRPTTISQAIEIMTTEVAEAQAAIDRPLTNYGRHGFNAPDFSTLERENRRRRLADATAQLRQLYLLEPEVHAAEVERAIPALSAALTVGRLLPGPVLPFGDLPFYSYPPPTPPPPPLPPLLQSLRDAVIKGRFIAALRSRFPDLTEAEVEYAWRQYLEESR